MLFKKENNYYAKFAAMEKAISRMNQQNSWLMQQAMN
jgi:flagellar hook-associated protein 2